MVAPTGAGKTHLARCVATACNAAFVGVNFGSWIPVGCLRSQGRQTTQTLASVLASNERTVLLIDELDKVTHESTWTTYLRAELYSLLDGNFPPGTEFDIDEDGDSEEHEAAARRRLKTGCWILGIGTWQSLWDKQLSRIGFCENETHADPLEKSELSNTIPRETLNRFSTDILVMPPMRAQDYRAAINAAALHLPARFQTRFRERAGKCIPAAVRDRTGCRLLEEILSEILIEDAAKEAQPEQAAEPS